MRKLHTRIKRRFGIASHIGKRTAQTKPKKKRPKTFKTEEDANNWAKKNKITKYHLKKVKRDKKFQIVKE